MTFKKYVFYFLNETQYTRYGQAFSPVVTLVINFIKIIKASRRIYYIIFFGAEYIEDRGNLMFLPLE